MLPHIQDKNAIFEAFGILKDAETKAKEQKKIHILPEIQLALIQCQLLLKKSKENPPIFSDIDKTQLSDELSLQLNILQFSTQLERRNFDSAHQILKEHKDYGAISYKEKTLLAKEFLARGAPEQALDILREVKEEAEQYKDIGYWLDVALICVFLNRKQEAINSASKAKRYAAQAELSDENKRMVLQNYNAIIFRYVRYVGKDEGGRLLPSLLEFQKEYPKDEIVIQVAGINDKGELTDDIKQIILQQSRQYVEKRDFFVKSPVPTYVYVKNTGGAYPDFLCNRKDPEFTIQFTTPDRQFVSQLKSSFDTAEYLLFDYQSLLDLSATDLLGFLERIAPQILIQETLFKQIQSDLIMHEIPELRRLWDFIRHSKYVDFTTDIPDVTFKLGDLLNYLDKWLVDSLKLSKKRSIPLVTNDLRLLKYLKSENMIGINIVPIINNLLEKEDIDEIAYSSVLGILANRFYTFISFDAKTFIAIVSEDEYRITPRSYHLVNQMLLVGSDAKSFISVFIEFIRFIWGAEIRTDDKIAWLEFITNKIYQHIDNTLSANADADIELLQIRIRTLWQVGIDQGKEADIKPLLPRIDQFIIEEKVPGLRELLIEKIKKRIENKE